MKIIICPDKFRDSMTASEVTEAIAFAVNKVLPDAQIVKIPLADGGEGSIEALMSVHGEIVAVDSVDPLYRPINLIYGKKGKTAVIDMSQVVGLKLLKENERNPEKTSTYGLGVVINHAIRNGAEKLLIAIGGSATNDCGIGMLSALGWIFLDENDDDIEPIGEELSRVRTIIPPAKKLGVEIIVLSDVDNSLYGENGAAFVYAPQKGADREMCRRLDSGLRDFCKVVKREIGVDMSKIKGGGAAGGVGAALAAMLGGKIVRGAEYIADYCGLFKEIKDADLIITGEGKVDRSTLNGKLPFMIAEAAKKENKSLVICCGVVDGVTKEEFAADEILQLVSDQVSTDCAMDNAREFLIERVTDYLNSMN